MRTPPLPVLLGAVLIGVLRAASPGQAASDPLRVELGNGVAIDLVEIPAGSFRQGSPESEAGRGADETAREVTLTRPFFLGKYPVTRGQWAQFVRESGYRSEAETGTSGGFGVEGGKLVQRREFNWRNPGFPQTDAHPVTIVTYKHARAFLDWLSRKTGRAFTLPTEAQWEYACRAGTPGSYPNGGGPTAADAIAWHRGNAAGGTHPVGEKAANAWGLHDMLGNVWEWCQDWYGPYPPGSATDPVQTNSTLSDKPRRVLRGGSFLKDAASCRSATRYRNDAASRNADNGFRVATFDSGRSPVLLERTSPPATSLVPAKPAAIPHQAAEWHSSAPSRPRSGPPGIFGWGILAMVLYLAYRLLRAVSGAFRSSSGGGSFGAGALAGAAAGAMGRSGPLGTRIVADGFWIDGDDIPMGATLDCRYRIGGLEQESSLTWDAPAGGKFVFTGSRPDRVSVSIRPGSAGEVRRDFDNDDDDWRRRNEDERARRARRDPPAY
jgi:formylglycine-generating enzyme required for sulfatase activity